MQLPKKDLSLIAGGFVAGAFGYKLIQRALDPVFNKKIQEYGKLTGDYYAELLKKGFSEDEATAAVYKKYPAPLWKKLGSNRTEAIALLGLSAAMMATKNKSLDNIAKGVAVFGAFKTIAPSQKIFIEKFTDSLSDRL